MIRVATLLRPQARAAPGGALALAGIREELRPVPDAAPPEVFPA